MINIKSIFFLKKCPKRLALPTTQAICLHEASKPRMRECHVTMVVMNLVATAANSVNNLDGGIMTMDEFEHEEVLLLRLFFLRRRRCLQAANRNTWTKHWVMR